MNASCRFIALFIAAVAVQVSFGFMDVTYFNSVIGQDNYFRVFTPLTYNTANASKRYPVIYFLHGCRGSHQYGDAAARSYSKFGLTTPTVDPAHGNAADYTVPYNPDFENYTDTANVIIIACNGNITGDGCNAWENLTGGSVDLPAMFKILIDTVDSRFNTIATPAGRAITGISLGGYAAGFIAGNLPDHFLSASQFCRSPGPFAFDGASAFSTIIDLNYLWRNFRGLPYRCSTNEWDYLQYYTLEAAQILEGASPGAESEYTDGRCHFAGNITNQLDFHRKYFDGAFIPKGCVSYASPYPDFDFNGYTVQSDKSDSGHLYFKDVTSNGFGVYTRETLPFGLPFPAIQMTVTTPANLKPATSYTVARYYYRGDSVSWENAMSNAQGRLPLSCAAPMGEEIGICGDTLPPPVLMLLDTFSETMHVPNSRDTVIGIDVVNLSNQAVTPTFTTSTENSDLFLLSDTVRTVTVPARSRLHIDSLVSLRATFPGFPGNIGYLKVRQSLSNIRQQREYLIQVAVMDTLAELDSSRYAVLDGRSGNFYFDAIREGIGDSDGVADSGEVISVWIYPPAAQTLGDYNDFRPAVPCITQQQSDFSIKGIHAFNRTNRIYYSVLMRVNRTFTKANPCVIPFQTKCQWDESNMGGLDSKSLQNFTKTYHSLRFPRGAYISVENRGPVASIDSFSLMPNPFNPSMRIQVPQTMTGGLSVPWSLAIYDISGRKVVDLTHRVRNAKVVWNAQDSRGRKVPGGIYFVCFRAGQYEKVKLLTYLP